MLIVIVMAYQLYRNTTLGNSLQESLDELIQVTRTAVATSFSSALSLLLSGPAVPVSPREAND